MNEHEVYMIEGIILIVTELKLYLKDLLDHFDQVLRELACECLFSYCTDSGLTLRSGIQTPPRQRIRQPISRLRSFDHLEGVLISFNMMVPNVQCMKMK